MLKNSRNITFALLILMIISEILSIVFNVIIMTKSFLYEITDEKTDDIISINIMTTTLGILLETGSILIMIFGIHSLYFKEKTKLVLFLIL